MNTFINSICIVFLLVLSPGLVIGTVGGSGFGTGEPGSTQDAFYARILKFELKKDDNSYVTMYEGDSYLNTIDQGDNSIASKLAAVYPPMGTYTGYRITLDSFKIQVTIVEGGTPYYTQKQSVIIKQDIWNLSTDIANYDAVTVNFPAPNVEEHDFISPLIVSGSSVLNIAWILQRNNSISYEFKDAGNPMTTVDFAKEEDVIRTFVADKVALAVQFTFTVNMNGGGTKQNIVSMLFDDSGILLGGYCHRPSDKAIGCNNMISPSAVASAQASGLQADFSIKYDDSDHGDTGKYNFDGAFDCSAGTYNLTSYSSEGTADENFSTGAGDTIVTTGAVKCITINN